MVNNINNLGKNTPIKQQGIQQSQLKQQTIANNAASEPKQARQDSVSLTPQAKQLNELQKKANESSGVNQKKVEQLKKAITSGEYKVDPEKLAASIARFEFDLI